MADEEVKRRVRDVYSPAEARWMARAMFWIYLRDEIRGHASRDDEGRLVLPWTLNEAIGTLPRFQRLMRALMERAGVPGTSRLDDLFREDPTAWYMR